MLNSIIKEELITKINSFFERYDINKDCADIYDNIIIVSESKCNQYKDLNGNSGMYDPKTRNIIIIDTKLTQRLFLHEYIHKKSAKHRLFRRDLLGIDCGKNLSVLDEAITEKITCEILSLSEKEQMQNGYASVFKAVDKLTELIPWEDIVQAYLMNNPKVFVKALGKKDLQAFLLCKLLIITLENNRDDGGDLLRLCLEVDN